MADVSARPGQAKSATVSRFELNPQGSILAFRRPFKHFYI